MSGGGGIHLCPPPTRGDVAFSFLFLAPFFVYSITFTYYIGFADFCTSFLLDCAS
jgi:hypothetical protein